MTTFILTRIVGALRKLLWVEIDANTREHNDIRQVLSIIQSDRRFDGESLDRLRSEFNELLTILKVRRKIVGWKDGNVETVLTTDELELARAREDYLEQKRYAARKRKRDE